MTAIFLLTWLLESKSLDARADSESESEGFSAAVTDDYYAEAWVLVLGSAKWLRGGMRWEKMKRKRSAG